MENFVATILQVYYEVLSDVSILDRFYNMRGVIMEIWTCVYTWNISEKKLRSRIDKTFKMALNYNFAQLNSLVMSPHKIYNKSRFLLERNSIPGNEAIQGNTFDI